MAQYDPNLTVKLDTWYGMSDSDRWNSLEAGYSFDETSALIVSWAQLFTKWGASIPEDTILKAYKDYVAYNCKLPA